MNMQIGSFVAKIGPSGKRNRSARRRVERRMAYHAAKRQTQSDTTLNNIRAIRSSVVDDVVNEDFGLVGSTPNVLSHEVFEPKVDLSGAWDETVARKALALFDDSGMSQRAFAAAHDFPESRIRSWKKKLGL